MRILINDFEDAEESYRKIFKPAGYEANELIFCRGAQDTKEFIIRHLETRKGHIDLMITNDSTVSSNDFLKCHELCYFKNNLTTSFSNGNFRISSIPIILYSKNDNKTKNLSGFDAIIKNDGKKSRDYFIRECEAAIKKWRNEIISDIDYLGIEFNSLPTFVDTNFFRQQYSKKVSPNSEYFFTQTRVLSNEFIKCPTRINYDWTSTKYESIERAIFEFGNTYRYHVKYNQKNNERTILHSFLQKEPIILKRDAYDGFLYEPILKEKGLRNSQNCDFILTTNMPEYLKTTFFEVKKENVKFFVNKNTKRPRFGYDLTNHLTQIWDYKKYSQNQKNANKISKTIGYNTMLFDYILLAGRKEEKEEMIELFEERLSDHYPGVAVYTYEEWEEINISYAKRFSRLSI